MPQGSTGEAACKAACSVELPFLPGSTLNFTGAKLASSVCANIPSSATVVPRTQPDVGSGLKQRSVSSFNRFSPGTKKLGGASKRMRAQGAPQFCLQNPG